MNLGLMLAFTLLSSGFSAWALVTSRWLLAAWVSLGIVEIALGTGEELAKLDLQDLNVPKDMKPAEVMRMTPPGSVWHRAAVRAARLHRAHRLLGVGLGLMGFVVLVGT